MNIGQIEENLNNLIKNFSRENFIYELLLAYGMPKTTITLLKKGKHNLAKAEGQIILKKKLFFQETAQQDLYSLIESIKNDSSNYRHHPRFIITTNYRHILAIDVKTQDTLDIEINDLNKYFDFFLPWAGIEKASHQNENPADVRASEKMAKIYDEIQKDNKFENDEDLKSLNIFLSRLLFCYFAEDTNIFEASSFVNSLDSHSASDGSDLDQFFEKLFAVLNTRNRENFPNFLQKFPYVNGGLFSQQISIPKFSAKSRKIIIECGDLDWKDINPDIFGSMMQAVVNNEQRSVMGMHYTSVPNIMKVLEPLFLQELKNEFDKNFDDYKKLNQLLFRLENIRIFDPACGSGNFLIIAFKELKKLEIEILCRIREITKAFAFPFSRIRLSQFYGIEIDDFACQTAKLSLWLAEHQMNVKYIEIFGKANPTLPLNDSGKIICGNATRLNWQEICPKDEGKEIYILGNPPYLGKRNQNTEQKQDIKFVLSEINKSASLDYICCWFFKASSFIKNTSHRFAFVSTNSICQGELLSIFWPNILKLNLEIFFAHTSFKWQNSAKKNAGVTCVIIGVRTVNNREIKTLFQDGNVLNVDEINPYLTITKSVMVERRSKPISNFPKLSYGNYPGGCTELFLNSMEKKSLIEKYPQLEKYIKKFIGSQEFIRGVFKYCLWFKNVKIDDEILQISEIAKKINIIKNVRLASKDESLNALASRPHQFRDLNETLTNSILIPIVSSEKRKYIPIGFIDSSTIVPNSAQVIYNAQPWIFAVITSKMHMVWVRAVGGRLKTDLRYSAEICYNTFPFPDINEKQKQTLTTHVYNIIEEREKHCEKTMAEIYDPDKMPAGLHQAHHDLDIAIELCYRSKPFTSDEERLEHLFKLYEEMTNTENSFNINQLNSNK